MDMDLNDEWSAFMTSANDSDDDCYNSNKVQFDPTNIESYINMQNVEQYSNIEPPNSTPIYISTKSKLSYLNVPVNLNIFWDIPITRYAMPKEGCIKKQAKINSNTSEELAEVQNKLSREIYVEQNISRHIDNPNGRIKFKDVRKVSVGICKKDLQNKEKITQAFYNCIALIMRFKIDGVFCEFHVKLFNTGKIEIPGIKNDNTYSIVLQKIIEFIQQFYTDVPLFCKDKSNIVLINSNFNCGFYINRENLIQILKHKYNIQPIYDPCNYPGVKAPFYYNEDLTIQTGVQIKQEDKDKYKNIVKIHCSIFRTGSVLILGTCTEPILNEVYTFITNLLKTEFKYICTTLVDDSNRPKSNKDKKRKSQKKYVITKDIVIVAEDDEEEIIEALKKVDQVCDEDTDEDDDADLEMIIIE